MVTFATLDPPKEKPEKPKSEYTFPYPDCPDHIEDIYIAIDEMLTKYKKFGLSLIRRTIIVPIVQWTEAVFFFRRFGNRGVLTFQTQGLDDHNKIIYRHWRVGYEGYTNRTLQAWAIDKTANGHEEKYSLSPFGGKEGDEPFPGYQSIPPEEKGAKTWRPEKKTIEMLESLDKIAGGIISHGSKRRPTKVFEREENVSARQKPPWRDLTKSERFAFLYSGDGNMRSVQKKMPDEER